MDNNTETAAKEFYGTKRISATPMTRLEYNQFRKWELPKDENGEDEGYLVEYLDGGKPNVEGYAGYVSWSPKEQFDAAYQPVTAMSFGHAVIAMKAGHKVARAGWNGKGMFIALMPELQLAAFNDQDAKTKVNDRTAKFIGKDTPLDSRPYFAMKTATGQWQPGWLASQPDMLADDWRIADGEESKQNAAGGEAARIETGPAVKIDFLQLIRDAAERVHKDSGVPSDVTGAVVSAVEAAIKEAIPPVDEKAA